MMKCIPHHSSGFTRMWPSGVDGELIEVQGARALVRVKLKGHTERNPSTAVISAPWNR